MKHKEIKLGEFLRVFTHVQTRDTYLGKYQTMVTTFLCQDCDMTHLQIDILGYDEIMSFVLDLDQDSQSLLCQWIADPQPIQPEERRT